MSQTLQVAYTDMPMKITRMHFLVDCILITIFLSILLQVVAFVRVGLSLYCLLKPCSTSDGTKYTKSRHITPSNHPLFIAEGNILQ
jgi:hypothetical protein